jgi:hypothetical protein
MKTLAAVVLAVVLGAGAAHAESLTVAVRQFQAHVTPEGQVNFSARDQAALDEMSQCMGDRANGSPLQKTRVTP